MTVDNMHQPAYERWNATDHQEEQGLKGKRGKQKQKRYDNALKVYVKNLSPDDESSYDVLMEHLSSCGKIQHEHFFEKALAGQRVLQGLLVFSSEEEAERATNLTGTVIGDRHVIVSKFHQFAQPTSKMVEVSNLSVETEEEDLWQFFEECGTIKYIHIERPLNAFSLRAEVHFKSDKGACKALKLSGGDLKGNEVTVNCRIAETEKLAKEFPVFVAGLSHDIQKDDLVNFFNGCGPIKRIKIRSKEGEEGHAIIFFMDADSAENAVGCNGNDIAGNVLSVTQREEGMLQQQFLNPVFLAGISRDTKDVDIFLKFQDCGLIHDVKFVQSKPNSLKKAYIEFKDPESISKAFSMNDLELKGQNLALGRSREIWTGFHNEIKPSKGSRKRNKTQEKDTLMDTVEEPVSTSEETTKTKRKKKKKITEATEAY